VTDPHQKRRELSPKIISGDSQWNENMQTQHIQAYNTIYEVQVKVITYWVPYIRVYKRWSQKIASKDNSEFCRSGLSLTVKHTLFALEESGLLEWPTPTSPSKDLSPHRFGAPTDNPHLCRRKEEDPHLHTDKIQQSKAWATTLSKTYPLWPKGHETRHAKASKVKRTQAS
jgi:hypothetical protein